MIRACHLRAGYGDISATPGNIAEHIICTAIMAFGAMSWGMVLGTIVGNLSSLDPEGDQFSQTMSELNKMMSRTPHAERLEPTRACSIRGPEVAPSALVHTDG